MDKGRYLVCEEGAWTEPPGINLGGATPLSDDEIRGLISSGLLPDLTDEANLTSVHERIQSPFKTHLKALNLFKKRDKATSALSLETLRQEIDARRSGSTRPTVTTREKEVRPMANDYSEYPPLDRTELRDGYKMSVGNARRLISDARALIEAGRHRSAYLILLLALEELGSALQLYETGRSGVQQWEAWWRRYFSHPKKLESTSRGIARREEANAQFIREELVYVNFDKNDGRFTTPREDEDSELRELVDKEAAYAEEVLKRLPPHAFERWELEEVTQQSPEIAPAALYARIEELVSQESTVSERDLLMAIAGDLGKPPDDFAAGYERWKEAGPKARVYVDILRRVQDMMKKSTRGGEDPIDGVDSDTQDRLDRMYSADGEALNAPAAYQKASSSVLPENPVQADVNIQERTNPIGDAETLRIQAEAADAVARDQQSVPVGTEAVTMGRNRGRFIQVRYQNDREGQVDDITLDELIESKQIRHFFRPSEDRWVDIVVDPVRGRAQTNTTGPRRRASDGEGEDEEKEKPRGFFSGLFRPPKEPTVRKEQLSAQEWFEQGFYALQMMDDCERAARALAHSIRLDPTYERAYVHRAAAYERLGNAQQAIEDYSRALLLDPLDDEVYYLRGLSFRRLSMDAEAITDLKKAADLHYRPAYDFLKSIGLSAS